MFTAWGTVLYMWWSLACFHPMCLSFCEVQTSTDSQETAWHRTKITRQLSAMAYKRTEIHVARMTEKLGLFTVMIREVKSSCAIFNVSRFHVTMIGWPMTALHLVNKLSLILSDVTAQPAHLYDLISVQPPGRAAVGIDSAQLVSVRYLSTPSLVHPHGHFRRVGCKTGARRGPDECRVLNYVSILL